MICLFFADVTLHPQTILSSQSTVLTFQGVVAGDVIIFAQRDCTEAGTQTPFVLDDTLTIEVQLPVGDYNIHLYYLYYKKHTKFISDVVYKFVTKALKVQISFSWM